MATLHRIATTALLTALSAGLLLAQPPQGQRQQRPWANYTRYHDANAQVPPRGEGEERVVFMGNSITEFWVGTHPDFFKENGYIGRGIGGQTSFQYLLRFREDVINLDPTIMVLNAGTNDIAENNNGPYNEEITLGNIKTMVDIARANGIKVILTSTLPCGEFGWNKSITDGGQKIVELNKKIEAYAKEQGIPFVNYHKEMVGPDGVSMRADLSGDGCHPNSEGYDIMEPLIQKAIRGTSLKWGDIDAVIAAMTLEEKAALVTGREIGSRTDLVPGAAGTTQPIPRLDIPSIVLTDGPAGVRISPRRRGVEGRTFFATGFPVGTALACTWNKELVEQVGKAIGEEVHEYGCDVLLAPGMNIHRTPLCGRNFEYYSEDPVLTGKIATAYVKGVQANDVGTSIKHYAVNSQETNRIEVDEVVSQRALREIYLKGFEIAVKEAHPWTVMSSYNRINGTWTQSSRELLTTILRDEWGFDGAVMTDWTNEHRTSFDRLIAGNDLLTPGHDWQETDIIEHVKDGSLDPAILDQRVRTMLELIVKSPRFKGYKYSDSPDLKAHAAITRQTSTEGMVLLENRNATLPLKGRGKVALFAPKAFIAGGTGSGNVNKAYVVDLETGLKNAGFTLSESRTPEDSDLAIIVIARQAGEGRDRVIEDDFNLTADEKNLLEEECNTFHAAGKKVVVVLNMGGVIETASWKNLPDAVLMAWQPGQEGGNSIADVLTGAQSPSGKLSMTFPVDVNDIPAVHNFPGADNKGESRRNIDYTYHEEDIYVGYRYFTTFDVPVSYPFGYGLSYTTFSYSNPSVKATTDGFTASITVTNTGSMAGKEIVQLYISAPAGGLEKPVRELKAFGKTRNLAPGESETLTFSVKDEDLASFNESLSRWETAKGKYNVLFCASSEDIRQSATYSCRKAWTKKVNDVLKLKRDLDRIHKTKK